jgi:hypothetical protein
MDFALRVGPELADPLGALEVGQHEHVEQFGVGTGADGASDGCRSGSAVKRRQASEDSWFEESSGCSGQPLSLKSWKRHPLP